MVNGEGISYRCYSSCSIDIYILSCIISSCNKMVMVVIMAIEETLCPECKRKMVIRTNKSNGTKFFGCPNYPECRGTRDVEGRDKHEQWEDRQKYNRT